MTSWWRGVHGKWAGEIILATIVYSGAAVLSLRLAFEKTNASPVWPPSGIALAAVLLLGYRIWPGIMLGAVLANIATFLANQSADVLRIVVVSSVIGAGNALEAIVGRFLLHRWVGGTTTPFHRAQDVLRFVVVALAACMVSATIGPTAITVAGMAPSAGYGTIWFTWWLGDASGVLLATPLLILWCTQPQVRGSLGKGLEGALLFVSLVVASHVASGGWLFSRDAHYPLTFMCLPWLVWSAFRFSPREAATAVAVTSGIAVWDTLHGLGPFVRVTINESLLLLQAFLGVVTITILTMAAVVAERREDQSRLRKAHDMLEIRVEERTRELSSAQAQLLQTQKMEAIGRLAAGVAHDFNNLLTVIKGRSQLALKRLSTADPLFRDVDLIEKTSSRASRVVEQLLAFSRQQILQPKVLDLNAVVAGMTDMLQRLIGEDVELAFVPEKELGRVRVDRGQLEQVIMNLAVNARDAMRDGGRWTIETANIELDEAYSSRHVGVRPGAYVRLSVTDTGAGIDEKTKARLFEPFFTTKELGKGTGLGLATAYGIVKQSGGNIWVYSEVGHGTTFKIYLPRVDDSPDIVAEGPVAAPPRGGTETVLVVEDEDDVRALTGETLETLGYTVLQARRPREAMLICAQYPEPIHLMLTDVVMPELNGQRLAERVTSGRPDMKILYMSGYTDDAIVRHGVLERGTRFLQKPFSPETLAAKVRNVLDEPTEG